MTGHPGDMEVRRRLEAFALLRLSPDPEAMRRMRLRLVTDAYRGSPANAAMTTRQRAPERRSRGRLVALMAAALAVVVAAGSVAASQAGGILYEARVWVETMALPGEPGSRLDGQLERLERRVDELRSAGVAGDAEAAGAALDAFERILAEIEGASPLDPAVRARAGEWLAQNQAVLEELIAVVPAQARGALEHAIDRSDHAVDQFGGTPGTPGRPSSGPGAAPGGTTPPSRPSPKPTKDPATEATPRATKPPSPNKPTPKPHATAKPTRSPSPNRPTPKPSPQVPSPQAPSEQGQGQGQP